MRYFIILILAILCFSVTENHAQVLEKRVTLSYQNESLARVLAGIKSRYGVSFSYANNWIPLDKKVSMVVQDKPLSQVLDELFIKLDISYTLVGQQIVLRKGSDFSKKPKTSRSTSESIRQGGMALPKPTDEKTEVTYLEPMASLLPIPYLAPETPEGLPKDIKLLEREFEAEKTNLAKNYVYQMDAALEERDTAVSNRLDQEFKSLMKNLKKDFHNLKKSVQNLASKTEKGNATSDSLSRTPKNEPVQVSFIPPLSTNGKENINSINQLSFNVLAGYSGGLTGVEIGGIANVEKGNVKGIQIAGNSNVVIGDVAGTQVAGFINVGTGHFQGAQVAGFSNVSTSDSSHGAQVAGFANVHKGDLFGTQVAGFINVNNGYIIGPQLAGFVNFTPGPISGYQGAGFLNVSSGNVIGVQTAGFLNLASRNLKGSQVAGFMNLAGRDVSGVQVASFLNIAQNVNGSQIGVINLADSVSGIQFGLFSFSRKGYRRLEFFGSEVIHANVAFKMGNRLFHNIFTIGCPDPTDPKNRWSYGLGFGSEFNLGKKGLLNLDLVCNQVVENQEIWTENLNLINQLKAGFGFKPRKRTTLFAGPTLNVSVSRVKNEETAQLGSDFIPDWNFYNQVNGKTRVGIWAGFQAGIRF